MSSGSVNNGWVFGEEASAGVADTLDTELLAYAIIPKIEHERSHFRGAGRYANTVSQTINEYSTWALEGILDYECLGHLLRATFGPAATAVQPDAPNSPTVYTNTWNLDGKTAITPKTWTMEYGDGARKRSATYGHVTGLAMEMSRAAEGKLTAELIARALTISAAAITTPGTTVSAQPIAGPHWDFYSEANYAALTSPSNKIAEIYKGNLDFGGLRSMSTPMDSTVAGFKDTAMGKEPEWMFETELGADATAEAFLTTTAANDELAFFSAQAIGPTISDDETYIFKVDFAAFVDTFDSYGDNDGIHVLPVDFTWAVDPVAAKMATITLQCEADHS